MDLKFTSNCFPSSRHFASCFAVYPWITYPRRAWVLDSFKCLNENSARFHVWIHLLFLGTVWSFKHWTCYWVHVCVLNTQWGPTNWDVRVWSRESIVAGPSEENRWLVLKKLPDFPKGFSKALKKKIVLEYSQLTMLWLFRVNSEETQPDIHMYPCSSKLASHPGCHITLSRVPCAKQ